MTARGCSGHFFIVLVGCDGHLGDFGVEGSAQSRQVQEPVDLAELFGGFEHPCRAPAQGHLTVAPAFDVRAVVSADLDHRLDGVGRAQRSGQGGRHPEAHDGEGLFESFAQRAGRAGMGAFELAGQVLQGGLGSQGGVEPVGGVHLRRHRVSQPFGQLGLDVSDLVQLAASDNGMVEHGSHRGGQGLGAVDDD